MEIIDSTDIKSHKQLKFLLEKGTGIKIKDLIVLDEIVFIELFCCLLTTIKETGVKLSWLDEVERLTKLILDEKL